MYTDGLVVAEVHLQTQSYCFNPRLSHEIFQEENSPSSLTSIGEVHSARNEYLGRTWGR